MRLKFVFSSFNYFYWNPMNSEPVSMVWWEACIPNIGSMEISIRITWISTANSQKNLFTTKIPIRTAILAVFIICLLTLEMSVFDSYPSLTLLFTGNQLIYHLAPPLQGKRSSRIQNWPPSLSYHLLSFLTAILHHGLWNYCFSVHLLSIFRECVSAGAKTRRSLGHHLLHPLILRLHI